MPGQDREYTSVEICAGAGGQALGLHQAGFRHRALIEVDTHACMTLEQNLNELRGRGECKVFKEDLKKFTQSSERQPDQFNLSSLGIDGEQIDLLAGGVPCPPFSLAGKQLGQDDERDLFPVMLDMVEAIKPRAVMIENVRGLLSEKFFDYRLSIIKRLKELEYETVEWDLVEARNFGVPQLRPRAILIALQRKYRPYFPGRIPHGDGDPAKFNTVAAALDKSMQERLDPFGPEGKERLEWWRERVARGGVAPTLVGGSKKHGGADLGPSRAKQAWEALGIDAHGVADDEVVNKDRDLFGPRGIKLTVRQAAIIQGFPEHWEFAGRKTAAYRQVGNAFPPPVARAMGEAIIKALSQADQEKPPLLSEERTRTTSADRTPGIQEQLELASKELEPA
ncbi:DNA (cytosine-5-)-methyltransferase [Planomonospora sp. ID91781]|nr:DNA (cytosine-5-)-methyltransferase [Planomonospora sp. ID91781]